MRRSALALAFMLLGAVPPASAQTQTWPAGSEQRFVMQCAGFHQELISPCRCTIAGVMREMSVEEFVKLTNSGAIAQDARYKRITVDCATRPRVRQ